MLKRITGVLIASALFSPLLLPAYAVGPGFYMGLMLGAASSNSGDQQLQRADNTGTTLGKARSNNIASRFYLGNKINQYASIEGGLTWMTPIHFNTSGVDTCSGADVRVNSLDLVGKGSFSLASFEVFGKAGAAVTYLNESGDFYPDFARGCGRSKKTIGFRPTFSVGVGYDLTQSWVADATMTQTMVGGAAKTITAYSLGISYHFTDHYCGQFLCED